MQSFADYVDRATEDRASQRNVITKENYASLVALAEQFECQKLQKDLLQFKSSWNERVDEMMTELTRSGEDERVRVLEEELSDDVDVLLERIQDLRFRDLSVKSLWNILSKSRIKGSHINSTELCRYILSNPSYSPLLEFVNLSEVPAEMALKVIEDENTQDWVSPKTFFPFMSNALKRFEAFEQELKNSKGEILALKEKSALLEKELEILKEKNVALERKDEELRVSLSRESTSLREELTRASSTIEDSITSFGISERNSVISWLRERELKEKRKLVVVRQSNRDRYTFLDPDSDDTYGSSSEPNAWVEIEFSFPIPINGFKVASTSQGTSFLRTFDVTFSDGGQNGEERKVSFVDETRLNGPGFFVEKRFDVFLAKLIRIESQGQNWSARDYFNLGGFELFSPDEQYQGGVFKSIFAKNRENVYEIFDVRARDFDGSEIHKRDTMTRVSTWGLKNNEWVEVGFVRGKVMVAGYRIRKHKDLLRCWSLRGSNNRNAPLEEWTVIHKHCEEEKTDKELQFECSSVTPFKFFRIVQEGKRWGGSTRIVFNYFDVDGVFIPD